MPYTKLRLGNLAIELSKKLKGKKKPLSVLIKFRILFWTVRVVLLGYRETMASGRTFFNDIYKL